MSSSLTKIVYPICRRGIHTKAPLPRPQRCFHQTTISALPRRRQFFTSNHLLAEHGEKDGSPSVSRETSSNYTQAQKISNASAPSTRKASRTMAATNLRLGPIKNQTKHGNPPRKPVPDAVVDDGTDYRRTISAICVAQSFNMETVQEILRFHAFELDPDGTGFDTRAVVHARGVNNGDIFVFPSGTVVAWAVPLDTLMTLTTKQLIRAAEYPHVDRLEMEQLDFSPDGTRDTSYMRGEVVVLGTRRQELGEDKLDTTLAKIAFSSGLARSPKIAVLENNLTDYFEDTKTRFPILAGEMHHKLTRSSVIKATGQLLSLRGQLNHYSDMTDQLPDMFWDSESRLEDYYNQIGATLDIRQRIAILNRKIDYAHENVSVYREMVSEKDGHRLEWIIIFLITIEVVFELRRVYREGLVETKAN